MTANFSKNKSQYPYNGVQVLHSQSFPLPRLSDLISYYSLITYYIATTLKIQSCQHAIPAA